MKYCKNCKADNPEDAYYCHVCGNKFHINNRGTIVFIIGILGIGFVCIGGGLMGYSLWLGLGVIMTGVGLMIWAYHNDES